MLVCALQCDPQKDLVIRSASEETHGKITAILAFTRSTESFGDTKWAGELLRDPVRSRVLQGSQTHCMNAFNLFLDIRWQDLIPVIA